ncbi:hypothetical protein Q9966_002914 [Columba livia]|nr:hypothetical protein Q9966_002914 [Columba livia]
MARRKAPQRRCREASKGSLEAKADQEPAGEAAGPSRCQTSGSAGTRLELVTRFWKSSPGSATPRFAKWRNETTKIAWMVFSLTCRGAGALVSLWTRLLSMSVFAMHKMAPKKNWFVMDRQRMQFLRDMRFFRAILLLLLVALGIYCTTSMPGWTTRAKGWMEEQICGSAIKRKIQSNYQALLVAQNQNMWRLLQEVAQLRVQLISARKSHQGTAVAPAPPVLPTSIPGYRHVQGQWAPISVPSTATATGASGGRNIPRSSPSAALLNEAPENPTDGFDVSEEMLLLEAHWLFGVTPAAVRVTEDGPRSSPTPGNTGGSSAEGNAVATPLATALGSDAPSGPSAAEPASADLAAELAIPEDELLQEALQLLGCSLGAVQSSQDGPGSSPVPGDLGDSGTEGNAVAPSPLELPMAIDGQQAALNIPGTSATVGASPGSNSPPVRCDLGTSVRMALPERDLYPPQKSCAAWQQTRSVGGGLYNLGDTCYLNSILQCLTYTPPLANYLLSRQHSQSCEKKGFCMMCTMEVHVEEVLSCSGSAVAPVAVVSELPRIGDFQFGAQEDAHEFFGCAVDAMQTACLSSSSDWDASQGGTVIDQVFGGLLRSRVTCWSCKAVSDTYEAFRDIPLDIKTATSVTGALEDFVRPEHLGGENSYKCSKCEQRVSASKRLTIHQSSNVLTVCLKRFDPFFGRKISKVVRYPEYLDLGKYTSEAAGGPLLYSLYAVLVHEGHSCQQGHYYCFVKASDGRWYKMDDESVVLCDIQTVLGQRAYLLFYVRAELVSLLHSWQRLGGADIPKATSAHLCPRCSARSFCNVSDALGADLLDRSCSIPDPQLVWRIVSQVEFYLSDENLAKDAFLLKHIQKNKMGFVKFLTCDRKLTLYTLRFSELLEANEEGTKVRRRVPIPESRLSIPPSKLLLAWELLPQEQNALSLLQKNFLETITSMFSPFGAIASIHILRLGRKLPSDACKYASRLPELLSRCCSLVEYESLGSARRALVELGHPGGQSIRVVPLSRKGSKKKPEVVEELVDHPGLKAQATAATFPYDLGGSLLSSARELNGASALPSLLLNKEPSEPTWSSSDFSPSDWSDTFTGSLLSSDHFLPFDANVGTGSCSSPESPRGAWGSGAPTWAPWAGSSSRDPKP